jgi:hypothetical protein
MSIAPLCSGTCVAALPASETSLAWPAAHTTLNGTLAAPPRRVVAVPPGAGVDLTGLHAVDCPLMPPHEMSLAPCCSCSASTRVRPVLETGRFDWIGAHPILIGAMAAASRREVAIPPGADVDTPSASPKVASPPLPTADADIPDLLRRIIEGYDADPLFASTEAVRKAYAKADVRLTHKGVWMTASGALVVPANEALRRDIVYQAHNPAACGHGGYHATLHRLKPVYYWAHGGMPFGRFIETYVRNCVSCQMNKWRTVLVCCSL